MEFYRFVVSVAVVFLQMSCVRSIDISYDVTLDDIMKSEKLTCVILDLNNIDSQSYEDQYADFGIRDINLNLVDISSENNRWYAKFFQPQVFPVTCVFYKGQIIDIIPGSSKESIAYIKKVLHEQKMTPEFHYNQKYDLEKAELISFYNSLLNLKYSLDNNRFSPDLINMDMESPYSLYLTMLGFLQIKDVHMARLYASKLLKYKSVKDYAMYQDEIFEARKTLDCEYSVLRLPQIQVKDTIFLQIQENRDTTIMLNVLNVGNEDVDIYDVQTSCSCIKLIPNQKAYTICPNDSVGLPFNFNSNLSGELHRDIYMTSNSVNNPLTHVTIVANVYK